MAGARIDQAADLLVAAKSVIQAGLVAGDARVDLVFAPFSGLLHQLRVREHRPSHGNEVGIAAGKDRFGDIRHIDAIACNNRDADQLFQAPGNAGKRCPRDHGRNGRYGGLVPGEVCRDDGDAGLFQLLGELYDFVP